MQVGEDALFLREVLQLDGLDDALGAKSVPMQHTRPPNAHTDHPLLAHLPAMSLIICFVSGQNCSM